MFLLIVIRKELHLIFELRHSKAENNRERMDVKNQELLFSHSNFLCFYDRTSLANSDSK